MTDEEKYKLKAIVHTLVDFAVEVDPGALASDTFVAAYNGVATMILEIDFKACWLSVGPNAVNRKNYVFETSPKLFVFHSQSWVNEFRLILTASETEVHTLQGIYVTDLFDEDEVRRLANQYLTL